MDEGLLREIASAYLIPLFSGAQLEAKAVKSSPRESLVAHLNPLQIAFKVDRNDPYRLVLSRRQSFAKSSKAIIVPELIVVQAFADVVNSMADALETPLRQDLLSTFQRRVVARAIGGPSQEQIILSAIDQLSLWATRLYEGAPIVASIGFHDRAQPADTVRLEQISRQDFGAVMGNGYDTLMEFNFSGRFTAHRVLVSGETMVSYCPFRQALVADWTNANENRVALTLNRLGEILLFKRGQLLFARRSGNWHFLTHDPIISQMGIPQRDRGIRLAMYETCLDASFSRTGACIGVIAHSHRHDWEALVDSGDQIWLETTVKTQAIARMIRGKPFHKLDRRLRQELTAIDGATVVSHSGEVLAVGAIVKIRGGSSGGGRMAAARALSAKGLGIKVSQDGAISGFREGQDNAAFRAL